MWIRWIRIVERAMSPEPATQLAAVQVPMKGRFFKGTVSRDGYFFRRSKHFNQYYFLCMPLSYTIINSFFAAVQVNEADPKLLGRF
jgi:hypothetical protein